MKPMLRTILAVSMLTAACSGGPDECLSGDAVAGIPDITAAPSFSQDSVMAGGTVTLNVPVDGQTGHVTVNLFSVDRTFLAEAAVATTAGNEIVSLPLAISNVAPPGDYFAIINVCENETACLVDLRGVAYSSGEMRVTGGRYFRIEYEGMNDFTSDETCYDLPLLTVN